MEISPNQIVTGHTLEVLKTFPDEFVDCVITSPPYWGLRDYGIEPQVWDGNGDCEHRWVEHRQPPKGGHSRPENPPSVGANRSEMEEGISIRFGHTTNFCSLCSAWKGSLGLEPTPELYIQHLIQIFDEVKRVLKKTGTCWVNIGDSYATSPAGNKTTKNNPMFEKGGCYRLDNYRRDMPKEFSAPAKSLVGIPEMFVLAMKERDTMDIYELDKSWIRCYIIDITEDKARAIQGQRSGQDISQGLCSEVETDSRRSISKKNERVGREKQGQNKCSEKSEVLAESRKGNNQSDEGNCKETQKIKDGSDSEVWWQSSKVCVLRGNENTISDDRSHRRQGQQTSSGNEKQILLNLRVVKENELSERFQSFVYELQLGNREIWILPPSRGRNLCLRKKDIPIDLLPLFKLRKEERWIRRNSIIWFKRNCMPSSAQDRFTVDFEYVYFFTKNQKYFFERQFEQYDGPLDRWGGNELKDKGNSLWSEETGQPLYRDRNLRPNSMGRNKRCVWDICTESFKDAHFATFPEDLVKACLLPGCPEFVCKKCGKPREKIYDVSYEQHRKPGKWMERGMNPEGYARSPKMFTQGIATKISTPIGYTDCGCGAGFEGGIMLDPFGGSGTSAVVAQKLRRRWIIIDIKPEYCEMARKRIKPLLAQEILI